MDAKPDQTTKFPEWSPGLSVAWQDLLASITRDFRLHGFRPVEVAALVPQRLLLTGNANLSDGGVPKGIFAVTSVWDAEPLGLRYDLTVPLSHYIAANRTTLEFPWRCFQVGKVWRDDKAEPGRFQEFYQADVDIIGHNELDLVYDAEIAAVLANAFTSIGIDGFRVHISDRRVIGSLLASYGVLQDRVHSLVRIVDEGGRQGHDVTVRELRDAGLSDDAADAVARLLPCHSVSGARDIFRASGADQAGLDDLEWVVNATLALGVQPERLLIDYTITRGHDYYTGTVFETFVVGRESWGSIGSGGRYDQLLLDLSGESHPAVGCSIGASRLFTLLVDEGLISSNSGSAAQVLIVPVDQSQLMASLDVANQLRTSGIESEMRYRDAPLDDHRLYASRLGIPYLLLVNTDAEMRLLETAGAGIVDLSEPDAVARVFDMIK